MPHEIGEMFWVGERPWHDLGARLDQPATLDEALAHGGLDWTVSLSPVCVDEEPRSAVAHRVAVVRGDRKPGDRGRVVGVVHPRFVPLQNREGAGIFHRLLDLDERRYHTGGYLRSGEVVWLLARLPDEIVVGDGDRVETYALWSNSHDGSLPIDIRLTTIRVVCRNTLSLALSQGARNAFQRAHRLSSRRIETEAKAFFEALRASISATKVLFERLRTRPCDDDSFRRFLVALLPEPAPPAGVPSGSATAKAHATRIANIRASRDRIVRVRREGIPECRVPPEPANWWGALNAVTGWVDHVQQAKGARYAHALFGEGNRVKGRAMELVKAGAST